MNIYDKLNDLVKAIETSEEFLRYKKAAELVDSNETHRQMAKDFITMQVRISTAQMLGQQPDAETIEQFNAMYTTISGIAAISEFIQAQMYFSKIMEDISKGLSNAANVDVSFLKILPGMDGDE